MIWRVSEQRWPMLTSFLPTLMPGELASTMKPVIDLCTAAELLVRAERINLTGWPGEEGKRTEILTCFRVGLGQKEVPCRFAAVCDPHLGNEMIHQRYVRSFCETGSSTDLQTLVPLITNPSPFFTALVAIPATSLPALHGKMSQFGKIQSGELDLLPYPGSVTQYAATRGSSVNSPRYFFLSSSDPATINGA